jgi:hypothetical protein
MVIMHPKSPARPIFLLLINVVRQWLWLSVSVPPLQFRESYGVLSCSSWTMERQWTILEETANQIKGFPSVVDLWHRRWWWTIIKSSVCHPRRENLSHILGQSR